MILIRIAFVLACAALAGCVTTGAKDAASSDKGAASGKSGDAGVGLFESKSGHALKTGLAQYADGKYVEAAKELQSALDLGLSEADQIKAHKHLAFIHCVSGRKPACRSEFLKALDINPNLELEPAEAGHPLWGPVFKAAKASKLKGESKADAPAAKPAKATSATKTKSSKTSGSK
jgi:hypothetical protein